MKSNVSSIGLCILKTVVAICLASAAEGRVARFQITSREVIAGGAAFGSTGAYEKLRGTVVFEVDPADSHNAVVFDIDKAPRNSRGRVEFSADMFILKPVDLQKGNGALLVEVPNRGGKTVFGGINDAAPGVNVNNPSTAADVGNGFLLRRGYTPTARSFRARAQKTALNYRLGTVGYQSECEPFPEPTRWAQRSGNQFSSGVRGPARPLSQGAWTAY